MTAFDDAIEDLHADEDLSVAASYRQPPYTWATVRLIRSVATDITGTARAGSVVVEVLASSLLTTPQRGDEIRLGATTYTVEDTERDIEGLAWKLTLSKPAED